MSNGELYTILTNKEVKSRKGAIVAMIKGTVAENIIAVLKNIPARLRKWVQEVTMDMVANMRLAIKRCFKNAHRVIDRFHVQKLAYDAVQEVRIKYRWVAIDAENEGIAKAKTDKITSQPKVLANGDTLKQLLARSRYLLFKHPSKWTSNGELKAELLFQRYPKLKNAYSIAQKLGDIFRVCRNKEQASKRLAIWYNGVEACEIDSFRTVARSIQSHYLYILNFFINRATNASVRIVQCKNQSF